MKKILDFPTLRQMDEYDCGASAMQSVLDYYGIDVGENNIIRLAKTKKSGTSTAGLKKVAKYFGIKFIEKKFSIEKIKKFIDKKIPVIVLIQAWGDKKEYSKDWKDGHYVVCIGYSKTRLYFEDPYCERRTYLTFNQFLERWHSKDNKRKNENWGMAVYRLKKSKKIKKVNCKDFWNEKAGNYFEKAVKMG